MPGLPKYDYDVSKLQEVCPLALCVLRAACCYREMLSTRISWAREEKLSVPTTAVICRPPIHRRSTKTRWPTETTR